MGINYLYKLLTYGDNMSGCFDYCIQDGVPNLKKYQALALDDKILYSTVKIKQFYERCKGQVYVSYSGGKDSTVLLHLVRSIYPDVKAVFVDTGLEFPEIREFARNTPNVDVIRPKKSFRKVIEDYGYPVIGKNAAHWIKLAKNGAPSGIRQMNSDSKFGYKRFNYMIDAPFKVSEHCCNVMKKYPAHQYHKDTGLCPIIGTRADESNLRAEQWQVQGENREGEFPTSNPILIWTDKDIWDYIHKFDLPYSKAYDMGYERTGCVFCMFGIMLHKDRFTKLKQTHPKLWEYCMRSWDEGGLGMKEVLEYMNVPTGCEEIDLFDMAEEKLND